MKNNKKILYLLLTLILIVPALWYFLTKNALNSTGVQAQTNLELKPDELTRINLILDNILSLNLTAVKNPAPDQNASPPYPRRTHRDPFQFGALPSLASTKKMASPAPDQSKKMISKPAIKSSPEFNPQNLKVSGIIYDRRKPAAIIEGEVYFPGDSLRNLKILRITPDALIVSGHGKQYKLRVPEDE